MMERTALRDITPRGTVLETRPEKFGVWLIEQETALAEPIPMMAAITTTAQA